MKWSPFTSGWIRHELFRPRPDGDWDYFPHGRFGRGYRVRSVDKDDLCNALLRFRFVLVVILTLVLAAAEIAISNVGGPAGDGGKLRTALSLIAFVCIVVLGILLVHWYARRIVRDRPIAETRLTAAGEYALWAERVPKALILPLAIFGALGCVGTLLGLWHVLRAGDWVGVLFLALTAALFGLIAWYYTQTWRHRPK